jgi:hypothetical protein
VVAIGVSIGGRNLIAIRSRLPAASHLETTVPHCLRQAAASLLEMTAAHRSRLAAARLLAARSLLAASLLPPECTWVVRLQVATLRARPAAANPATSRTRCPSRRSRTRTLRPGPLGWSQECGHWSRKLKEIVLLNHVS